MPDDVKTENTYGAMLQKEFGVVGTDSSEPNKATPENLAVLVARLREMTDELEKRRDDVSSFVPDMGVVIWDKDLADWKLRLEAYEKALKDAAPDDREIVLWTVTAPLLLGLFGGPDGSWPTPGRTGGAAGVADANTPFMLSHAFTDLVAWREERWNLLLDDLKQNAKDVADAVTDGASTIVVAGAAIVGGYFLLKWLSNR